MSVALCLFQALCKVGNALEAFRDGFEICSDDWTAITDILGMLDQAIDVLVHSQGLDDEED